MKSKIASSLVAALLCAFFGASAYAADECGRCQIKLEAKKKLKDSEAEYSDLLRRNKEFLAKIGPSDNSKLIKLSSNITLINIKLDGIHKNIAELDVDLSKDDCVQCVPTEPGLEPSAQPEETPKPKKGK